MKRRLSVAISSICNPKLLFFDEPTTGLDPVSKRSVWKLIKKLKEDRVMILTTHSMEEADNLADTIGIMSKGRLITTGTSITLRNEFGNGYKLNLVTKPEYSEMIEEIVCSHLPQASLVTSNAGSISYTVPKSCLKDLSKFFEELQLEVPSNAIIDWGISHSSLEEVFHNVTSLSDEDITLLQNGELLTGSFDDEDMEF